MLFGCYIVRENYKVRHINMTQIYNASKSNIFTLIHLLIFLFNASKVVFKASNVYQLLSHFPQSQKSLGTRYRNQAKLVWTICFDICFCIIFGCYGQSYICGSETRHQSLFSWKFQFFNCFVNLLYQKEILLYFW